MKIANKEYSEIIVAGKEGVPLFMKDSLLEIWEDPLIREYPEQLQPKEVIIPHCKECEHIRATPQGKRGTRYDCEIGWDVGRALTEEAKR